jgi:hypothetical protein
MNRDRSKDAQVPMNDTIRVLPVAILIAVLGACSGGTKTATPTASADRPPAEKPAETSTLADLAQRDVEAFLNRRNQTEEKPQDAPVQSTPRQIVWNQNADTARPAAPKPAATDEEFKQSPLFLIADEPVIKPEPKPETVDGFDALDRDRVRELVVELSKELYRDAAHADMPLRELFLIAATTLVSPDRALNADAIPGLTPRERDMLREFQSFFAKLGATLDGSTDAEEAIVSAIEQLRSALRTDPQLTLGTVALCTRVGGFGDFDKFNKYAFLAHSEQQAVVYIEIAGFTSELNQRDEWVTELSQQLTIYSDRDGIPVWREDWQTAADRSRNKRTDFFVVQLITLPKALSVGRYHLKVRVRDERSRAEAEASIPFEMVADPKMAASVR